ncbi:MAG: PilT/PilU family type 4a pilus ATPase [Verrucomicrobiaceae bacterium]|nr:MAG: PilT/PilU family type 4a pilus ATPase [Verrucomicrobiaceae bacterium]
MESIPGPVTTNPTVFDQQAFDNLLRAALASFQGISDLLFVSKKVLQVESQGQLQDVLLPPFQSELRPQDTEAVARLLMGENKRLVDDLARLGGCDTSYAVEGLARFRVNVFKQNGNFAIVMRKLASEVPQLDKLGVPPIFGEVIKEKTGIILVTGATGSGKTTTLAAMLNELNRTSRMHIVTLEDPIEFYHPHQMGTFSQRELGKDFPDFASGLRSALRQAPKVILVGEIRDRETMEIALTASETGHVVYSTMHTVNAAQTINRILGMFSQEEETQVRARLADTLRYVISQRLVPKVGGGRLLVPEIMGSNLRSREVLIYGENENRSMQEIIEAGMVMGWQSFDQALLIEFDRGLITEETAMLYCNSKSSMLRALDYAKKLRPGATDENAPTGLRLQNLNEAPLPELVLAPPPLPVRS